MPSDIAPAPVRPVPGVRVRDECNSMAFVTPAVAMLRVPVPVIGPPVRPGPLPTLLTVPEPGKVWPTAKVKIPLLLIFKPVSAGEAVPWPKRRFSDPVAVAVLLPTGSAFN